LFSFLVQRIFQGIKIEDKFTSEELSMRFITKFVIKLKHGIYTGLISEIPETIINHKIILSQATITPPPSINNK
jgi:hypothetical protein